MDTQEEIKLADRLKPHLAKDRGKSARIINAMIRGEVTWSDLFTLAATSNWEPVKIAVELVKIKGISAELARIAGGAVAAAAQHENQQGTPLTGVKADQMLLDDPENPELKGPTPGEDTRGKSNVPADAPAMEPRLTEPKQEAWEKTQSQAPEIVDTLVTGHGEFPIEEGSPIHKNALALENVEVPGQEARTATLGQRLERCRQDRGYIERQLIDMKQYKIKAVTHVQLMKVARPVFIKHGVRWKCVAIDVISNERFEHGGRTYFSVWAKYTFRFKRTEDPDNSDLYDYEDVVTLGHCLDNQDKGPGKGQTTSEKNAIFSVLNLERGDDPDTTPIDIAPDAPAAILAAIKDLRDIFDADKSIEDTDAQLRMVAAEYGTTKQRKVANIYGVPLHYLEACIETLKKRGLAPKRGTREPVKQAPLPTGETAATLTGDHPDPAVADDPPEAAAQDDPEAAKQADLDETTKLPPLPAGIDEDSDIPF